jgi:hypothetical protein
MAVFFFFGDFGNSRWARLEELLAFGRPWDATKTLPLHCTPHLPPVSAHYPLTENAVVYDLSVAAGSEPSGLLLLPTASVLQTWPNKRGDVPYILVKVGDCPIFRLPARWHHWFAVWLYDRSISYDNRHAPLLPWEDFHLQLVSCLFFVYLCHLSIRLLGNFLCQIWSIWLFFVDCVSILFFF